MKNLICVFIVVCYVLLCSSISSSQAINSSLMTYDVTVTYGDNPVPYAKVITVLESQGEIFLDCDENGYVEFETSEPVTVIYGAILGLAGSVKPEYSEGIILPLKEIRTKNIGGHVATASSMNRSSKKRTGTFGVYSTNGDGDVTFKYMGDAKNYFCTSWLPDLSGGDKKYRPDPNKWDKKSVSSFKSPYKGKLLYVPRRYQEFHKYFYGWSISSALFMKAEY